MAASSFLAQSACTHERSGSVPSPVRLFELNESEAGPVPTGGSRVDLSVSGNWSFEAANTVVSWLDDKGIEYYSLRDGQLLPIRVKPTVRSWAPSGTLYLTREKSRAALHAASGAGVEISSCDVDQHEDWVIVWSSDSKSVAIAGRSSTCVLSENLPVRQASTGSTKDQPATATFRTDGQSLIVAQGGIAVVLDLKSGSSTRIENRDDVVWLSNEPVPNRMLVGLRLGENGRCNAPDAPGELALWERTGAKPRWSRKQMALADVSPDGKEALVYEIKNNRRYWTVIAVDSGTVLGRNDAENERAPSWVWRPKGGALALGGRAGVRIWSYPYKSQPEWVPESPSPRVLDSSPDGALLVADHVAVPWSKPDARWTIPEPERGESAARWSSDGHRFLLLEDGVERNEDRGFLIVDTEAHSVVAAESGVWWETTVYGDKLSLWTENGGVVFRLKQRWLCERSVVNPGREEYCVSVARRGEEAVLIGLGNNGSYLGDIDQATANLAYESSPMKARHDWRAPVRHEKSRSRRAE